MDKDTLLEILADHMPNSPLYEEPVIDEDYISIYMGNALEAWEWLTQPDIAPRLCAGAQRALTRAVHELAHAPDKLRALPLLTSYPDFRDKFFVSHAVDMQDIWRVYAMWSVSPLRGGQGWRVKAYFDYGWTPTLETIAGYIVTPDMSATRLATMIETHYPWRMFA